MLHIDIFLYDFGNNVASIFRKGTTLFSFTQDMFCE